MEMCCLRPVMTSFPFIAPFFIPSQQTGKRHDKEIESHFSEKPKRVENTNIQEEITDQGVHISVWTEKFPNMRTMAGF